MTIEQTEVVDFIGIDEKRANLLILDDLEWGLDDEEHLFLLQEKVNSYLRFFENGEMHEKYPNSLGKNVEFEIAFKFFPSEKCEWFLEQLKPILSGAGITLLINTSKAS